MDNYVLQRHELRPRRCTLAYVDHPGHPCAADASGEEPLGDSFRLLLPREERVENRTDAAPTVATPVMAVLHTPDQDLGLEIDPSRLLLVEIDGDFARQALARRFVGLSSFEMWASVFPLDSPAAVTLCSFCHWLARELSRPESLLHSDQQVIDSMERTLLAFFVELMAAQYPSLCVSSEDLVDRQLAQIEDWVEENLSETIGVEDLAAVADVSARTVQSVFRRRRGCTPMQFVLSRRLDRARELLQAPEPQVTVAAVAMECGVFQFGRFAVQYRQRFGEKPSETLARARALQGLEARTGDAGLPAGAPG